MTPAAPEIPHTTPCGACLEEGCGPDGCERYALAGEIMLAAGRLAAVLRDLDLGDTVRQRAAAAVADAMQEALGAAGGHLDRTQYLRACGCEVTL